MSILSCAKCGEPSGYRALCPRHAWEAIEDFCSGPCGICGGDILTCPCPDFIEKTSPSPTAEDGQDG